jgi:hypothetical protein
LVEVLVDAAVDIAVDVAADIAGRTDFERMELVWIKLI